MYVAAFAASFVTSAFAAIVKIQNDDPKQSFDVWVSTKGEESKTTVKPKGSWKSNLGVYDEVLVKKKGDKNSHTWKVMVDKPEANVLVLYSTLKKVRFWKDLDDVHIEHYQPKIALEGEEGPGPEIISPELF